MRQGQTSKPPDKLIDRSGFAVSKSSNIHKKNPGKFSEEFPLLMPLAKPTEPDTYICTTIRLDTNNTYYIGNITYFFIVNYINL